MSWFESLKKSIASSLKEDIDSMTAETPEIKQGNESTSEPAETIGRKAILTDPYYENVANSYYLSKSKLTRISNHTLKHISIRDWLVSAIIQIRCDTLMRFSRPQHKRFEMGFRVVRRDNGALSKEDHSNIEKLERFIYNCGTTEDVPNDDRMVFGEFLKLIVRDGLTFGYVGVEKIKTRDGSLHRFRPVSSENLFIVNPLAQRNLVEQEIDNALKSYKKKRSDNDYRNDGDIAHQPIEYYKYVQTSSDGKTLAAFGDEDLIFKLFNPQNFSDSNGYCLSVIEQAITMITNHLNLEQFNANFFTNGYAARGILHLKGTVTQNNLAAFRRQFYNTISGTQHAWRTPIVTGLEDVQWVPMNPSARDMEYLNFNSHIMRALCAQFQIDPIEVGLDYLTTANGRAASQAKESGQFKITYSRERGLVPIMMTVEDMINCDILPALDKQLAATYKFIFVGLTDETAQTDVALRQAQSTTFASMNDLLRWEEKTPIEHPAAYLPLNQAFWALINSNFTRGEIREHFFGDKGASQRKELQYIPNDSAFLAWNQFLSTIETMKHQQQQQEQQQEQQQQQLEMQQSEEQRNQEQHDAQMSQFKDAAARAAVNPDLRRQLHDTAKQFGATSAEHIGGTIVKNPLNVGEE